MDSLRRTRVTVRADSTSFRDPFRVIEYQPTYYMPPPSTVFGFCLNYADAARPSTFNFGIHFTFEGTGIDLEHQHITSALGAQNRITFQTPNGQERATTVVRVQPVRREFLHEVQMTLYLDPELRPGFEEPRTMFRLGRSQDLAEILDITDVTLVRPTRAKFEHTLLPGELRPSVRSGAVVLMSRYRDLDTNRIDWATFIVLHQPVYWGDTDAQGARFFRPVEGLSMAPLFCDPTIIDEEGYPRAVWIHRVQ